MKANYQILRSSAGFRIGLASLPQSECAALSIHVPAGSRDDPAGLAGLAHFVEHMAFKGTATRDARRISIETEDVGASLNACTSEDQIVYEARGDAETLPLLVDVLADMVWNSTFPAAEIELERDVIGEEIVMYWESPSDHIGDLLSRALWPDHPLGEPITGTPETLAAIDRAALLNFARSHHARRDAVVALAGPFEAAEVLALLEPKLPAATEVLATPPFAAPRKKRPALVEPRDTQQVQLALAYATFGRHDPRRHALRLLATVLGEGASSRLFQTLREEKGLCYHVSCDATLLADTGALEVHAGLDPDSRDEALETIHAELKSLADRGPNDAELARAKRLLASQTRSAMESTAAHAGWIGETIAQHDDVFTPEDALARLTAVTAGEIRDLAAELFVPAHEALAEIRPE